MYTDKVYTATVIKCTDKVYTWAVIKCTDKVYTSTVLLNVQIKYIHQLYYKMRR